jgi:hypothetical protein
MIFGLALSPFNGYDWQPVSDLEVRQASQLKPATVVFDTRYDSGLMEVVHVVGRTYYRIVMWDGEVYYAYHVEP